MEEDKKFIKGNKLVAFLIILLYLVCAVCLLFAGIYSEPENTLDKFFTVLFLAAGSYYMIFAVYLFYKSSLDIIKNRKSGT